MADVLVRVATMPSPNAPTSIDPIALRNEIADIEAEARRKLAMPTISVAQAKHMIIGAIDRAGLTDPVTEVHAEPKRIDKIQGLRDVVAKHPLSGMYVRFREVHGYEVTLEINVQFTDDNGIMRLTFGVMWPSTGYTPSEAVSVANLITRVSNLAAALEAQWGDALLTAK